MSSVAAPGEGQLGVDQNGGSTIQQLEMDGVPRDTSSIPGVSMYARQCYPPTFFKHAELITNKDTFFEALNKFHTVLGTRLTKKGRKGKERAAEVKSFEESIAGIPPLGGVVIDLHLLYVEVTSRGGLEKVIKDRKWREVTNVFKFPNAVTSGSYMLRKYYVGLLYYFEQAYFFGKQGPLVPPPTADGDLKSAKKRRILPMEITPVQDPGLFIGVVAQGAVEGTFDQGYLVTVTVGAETLQGVLYHLPPVPTQRAPQHATVSNYAGTIGAEVKVGPDSKAGGSWRKRPRKEEMLKKDPNAPRPSRTGYNFFFAEQCSKFKALHPDADKELSRIIGHAWNSLTEEEKLPYQQQGIQDKVRYAKQLQEYQRRLQSDKEDAAVDQSVQRKEAEEEAAAAVSDSVAKAITDSDCLDDNQGSKDSTVQLTSELLGSRSNEHVSH